MVNHRNFRSRPPWLAAISVAPVIDIQDVNLPTYRSDPPRPLRPGQAPCLLPGRVPAGTGLPAAVPVGCPSVAGETAGRARPRINSARKFGLPKAFTSSIAMV